MAIGAAAAIGLGVAGIGSVLSSKSQKKAAKNAANVSQENNAQNIALQREIYGKNQAALSPFMVRGNAAGAQLNALLGLGGTSGAGPQPPTNSSPYSPYTGAYGSLAAYQGATGGYRPQITGSEYPAGAFPNFSIPGPISGYGGGTFSLNGTQATPVQSQVTSQQAAEDAFNIFRDNTGYKFRKNEALDAVNSGYSGAGVLQSGAAMEAVASRIGQEADNTFGQYSGILQGQQAVGAGAASSSAGVGQNFASSVTAANDANAANQANALLYRGQNNIGNTFANMGGVLAGL